MPLCPMAAMGGIVSQTFYGMTKMALVFQAFCEFLRIEHIHFNSREMPQRAKKSGASIGTKGLIRAFFHGFGGTHGVTR